MSLSVDNDVQEPDIAAVIRVIMLIISVIFGVFRSKIEDLLKGRPEHMELLQSVYRELSVAAMISMFLSLIGTGSVTANISHLFGYDYGERINDSLHSLHIIFLLGILLYMAMSTMILAMLRIIVSVLKQWDDQTIQSGIGEVQGLLDHPAPGKATLPVFHATRRAIQRQFAKRKLAWLMYREVFFMQFVCDSEDSSSDFSYVRYLRLAIYEVCLQLTEIRGTAGVVIVILIVIRWIRVRYLNMNWDVGLYGTIAWEFLSFAYLQHVNSRIMCFYQEYLIDPRKFTRQNLQDFQDRIEKFGLRESQQTHDTSDNPKVVVEGASEFAASKILENWIQHKVEREKRRDQLIKIAAAKFLKLKGSKGKYKSNQIVPEQTGSTPDQGEKKSCNKMLDVCDMVEGNQAETHELQTDKSRIVEFQNDSATIRRKVSAIKQQADNHPLPDVTTGLVEELPTQESKPEENHFEKHAFRKQVPSYSLQADADHQSQLMQSPLSQRHSIETGTIARILRHSTSFGPQRHSFTNDNRLWATPTQPQGNLGLLAVQSSTNISVPALNLDIDTALQPNTETTLASPIGSLKASPSSSIASSRRPSMLRSPSLPISPTNNREKIPILRIGQISEPEDTHGSRNESHSRKGSPHQDGHQGFRQSVRKSLQKPADEIAKQRELNKRRSISLSEHIKASSDNINHQQNETHKKNLYTFRVIASFGGSKLEHAQGDDMERSFRWWASPGAEGLISILHSIVLVDTIVFGVILYLLTVGDHLVFLGILIPLILKLLLAPIMIYNYTMITSSGSMTRIELLMLAIHQKMEEDTMAKINRTKQARISRHSRHL